MAYKALYRKYRPNSFESIVGQTAIVRTLHNIVKENKISHAYLFNGPRGTGKTSAAKVFAKAINCLEPKEGAPCGECSICKQIENNEVNDIVEIDAASNNGVDEIRDLKSKINLAPTSCKYKIYIIDEVHMLSIGAFNALLKTLEEPPHYVVFILATTEMHKLPLTIISRCQNFNFKKINEEQLKLRLDYIAQQEKIKIEEQAIAEIARLSDGGMRDAIGLLEQLFSFTNNDIKLKDVEMLSSSVPRGEIVDLIKNVRCAKVEELFKSVEDFYKNGKDFIKITEDMVIFLKDLILYKKASQYFNSISNYDISEYNDLIESLDDELIYNYIQEFNKSISDLRISNHPKTIFEITLLKLVDNNVRMTSTKSEKPLEIEIPIKEESEKVDKPDLKTEKESTKEAVNSEKHELDINVEVVKVEDKTIKMTDVNDVDTNVEIDESIYEGKLPQIEMPLYKKVIINNTLASADKKMLAEVNNKCNQLQTFLINKDYKQAATILLDGKIVGISDKNVIWTYPYDVMVEKADELIEEIERLFDNIVGNKFRVINITEEAWLNVRPYYIKVVKEHTKIEVLPEEGIKLSKAKAKGKKRSKEIEAAINMFGEDLIEIK